MHRYPALLCAAAFAISILFLAPTSSAVAAVVFDDDFAEFGSTPGFTSINQATLDNFSIVDGSVDAFTNTGFSLACPSTGCLDLDGTTGNAGRLESVGVNLTSGLTYTLSLNLSGNQRNAAVETLTFGLLGTGGVLASESLNVLSNSGFFLTSLDFTATATTVAQIFIDHDGGDNFGIILDRVTLTSNTVSTVPLPAALPLLALGLAGLGFSRLVAMKRRR